MLFQYRHEYISNLVLQVLMKDIVTPVPQDEVKAVIRKCLEQAALVNYQRLSEYAKVEGRRHINQFCRVSSPLCAVFGNIAPDIFFS